MSFLKAEWRKLAFANYEVHPEILVPYLPYGTELDFWNNRCYISLIGFMFQNTRLLGVKVPCHINFEEVNLRFYVKRWENGEWRRGVVFIKEMVPRSALTFVANTFYNENYETREMGHRWLESPLDRTVEYRWKVYADWEFLRVTASKEPSEMRAGGETEFITEHYWGYAKVTESITNEYQVTHPKWEKYDVLDYEIGVDFGRLYGSEFGFLNHQSPRSVLLAEGSNITVETRQRLVAGLRIPKKDTK